jgi:transposase-like protein/ribosomal protein L37AE/L43A
MTTQEPRDFTTLQEAIVYFSNPDNCVAYMVERRWRNGVVACPTCGRTDVRYIASRRVWQCKTRHAKCQFSVKVGTIMEDSPIPLDKWLMAMWMVGNCRNGVSSYEIHRNIGVSQKTAWFLLHRIREAMKMAPVHHLADGWNHVVEVDETYISGNPKNMHADRRLRINQTGENKSIVMGMLDRQTREVRAKVIPNAKRATLQNEILKNVGFNAHIYTDQHLGYEGLDQLKRFTHKTVNHTMEYVKGRVHTQGIENFWALLKRSLKGTYVAVEPFHLDRYVDEQAFRFNSRVKKQNDAQRLDKLTGQLHGRRLTWAELTGKNAVAAGEF